LAAVDYYLLTGDAIGEEMRGVAGSGTFLASAAARTRAVAAAKENHKMAEYAPGGRGRKGRGFVGRGRGQEAKGAGKGSEQGGKEGGAGAGPGRN